MRKVLILGAGGHGQMVADVLLAASRAGAREVPIGFLDDDERLLGSTVLGLPVLGAIAAIDAVEFDAVVVAIGDNHVRRRISVALQEGRVEVANAIHPTAIISRDVRLGCGVFAAAGVIVNTGSTVGDGALLSTGCTIGHHGRIDEYAHVGPGVHLGGYVSVACGAMIGVGGVVIPGKAIGAWAIVGAGAVVIDDIPSHHLAVGVPARPIKTIAADAGTPYLLPTRWPGGPLDVAPQVPTSGALPEL